MNKSDHLSVTDDASTLTDSLPLFTLQGTYNTAIPFTDLPPSASTDVLGFDQQRLDAVKRAADNIIKEKDLVIERYLGESRGCLQLLLWAHTLH